MTEPDAELPDDRRWLDADHYLEPVDPERVDVDPGQAVVRDARGRLWRLRRRPPSLLVSLALILAFLVLVAMISSRL
jgi:hypothetical protein